MTVRRTLDIINEKGLHARASAKFVEVVEAHDCRVDVSKDGMTVSGDSIMGLLMLGAGKGSAIEILIEGEGAEELADKLERLVKERFGEEF